MANTPTNTSMPTNMLVSTICVNIGINTKVENSTKISRKRYSCPCTVFSAVFCNSVWKTAILDPLIKPIRNITKDEKNGDGKEPRMQ